MLLYALNSSVICEFVTHSVIYFKSMNLCRKLSHVKAVSYSWVPMPDSGEPTPGLGEVIPGSCEVMLNTAEPMPNTGDFMPSTGEFMPSIGEVIPDSEQALPDFHKRVWAVRIQIQALMEYSSITLICCLFWFPASAFTLKGE